MKKRLAVAFTGPSNSGKTTIILKVARKLIHEHAKDVAIIKHDPKDKARFDVEGKDSYKFSQQPCLILLEQKLISLISLLYSRFLIKNIYISTH